MAAEEPSFDEMYDRSFAFQKRAQETVSHANAAVTGAMPVSQTATLRHQDWGFDKSPYEGKKKEESPLTELTTAAPFPASTASPYSHVWRGPPVRAALYGQTMGAHLRYLKPATAFGTGGAQSGPAAALRMFQHGGGSSTYGDQL